MSEKKLMKIYEKDRKEYNRLKNNVKSKVNRLMKKGLDVTDKINLPSLESMSRSEFNEWKQEASSFTNRYSNKGKFVKNKHGFVESVFDIKKAEKLTQEMQRKVDKERERISKKPYYVAGKEMGTVGTQLLIMGRPEKETFGISRPLDFNFDNMVYEGHLKEKIENLERQLDPNYYPEANERLKQNFIKALQGSFHSLSDITVLMLERIPADDFYELFLEHSDISFRLFDSKGANVEATEATLQRVQGYFEDYIAGDFDDTYKNFPNSH